MTKPRLLKLSLRRRLRQVVRAVRRMPRRRVIIVSFFAAFAGIFMVQQQAMNLHYTQLLDVIAQGESHGNYNAYYGNADNQSVKFTDMTVAEVLAWQDEFVGAGNASSAVGKYQFLNTTLEGLVNELGVSRTARFDAVLQDKLATQLIKRRGAEQYARGDISREQFAHNLSKEWAALPRVIGANPTASYYDGDGMNHAHISIAQVLAAVETLRERV